MKERKWLHLLFECLLIVGLVGCAHLPERTLQQEKYLAVQFNGGSTTHYSDMQVSIAIRGREPPVILHSGLNYIPFKEDNSDLSIYMIWGNPADHTKTYHYFASMVNWNIASPNEGTIVLLPWKISFTDSSTGSGGTLYKAECLIEPMKPGEIQDILKAWKKDKKSDLWEDFIVAPKYSSK